MDHVDQAPYTHIGLSGGIRRSALKTTLINIATAALAAFVSSASAQTLVPARATGPIQVAGPAGRRMLGSGSARATLTNAVSISRSPSGFR